MKSVTLTVEMFFDVPDDTPLKDLSVEFPTGNPVIHGFTKPIEGGQFGGHQTTVAEPTNPDAEDDDASND